MKFLPVLMGSLVFIASVHAQYFSEGWAPGKPIPKPSSTGLGSPQATPISKPKARISSLKDLTSIFDLTNLLTSEPVASLAARAGINITEKVAAIKSHKFWDERITLIDDDNYGDLIVNETLNEEEEKNRVWFVVITVTSSGQEGISKYVDQVFDSAFNLTQEAGDLPNVKWGRINYLNVTMLTTKWSVWSAPYLVVITDRGQSLRFWKASQIRLNQDIIRQFLLEESWKLTPPWQSAYAPGGDREWIMEYIAIAMTTTYNKVTLIPNWLLYIITGAFGSFLIGLLHRNPQTQAKPKTQPKPKVAVSEESVSLPDTTPANSSTKQAGTKTKKSGKK